MQDKDKYDVMIALGGTNIERRMDLVIYGYHKGETHVVMFVGAWQGKRAAKYFSRNGITPYDEGTGLGYIVRNDSSRTTTESAVYARLDVDRFGLGDKLCVCTESYHGLSALADFRRLFPKQLFSLDLRVVDVIKDPLEKLIRIGVHEPIRKAFDVLYVDLPVAITKEDIEAIRRRELALQKAAYNPLRDKIESPLFEMIKRFRGTGLYKLMKDL